MKRRWQCWTGTALVVCALTGCGLTNSQKLEVQQWEMEAKRNNRPDVHFIEHLDPEKAAGLGFLPFGVGGFYVRRPGLGVSGILCWPVSIAWLPAIAYQSAYNYNYEDLRGRIVLMREQMKTEAPATRTQAEREADDPSLLLDRLEAQRRQGRVSEAEYREIRERILRQVTP